MPQVSKPQAADMGAVFNELNRGEAVTAGLKKVDPSQMTHKNPSLRANAPVPTRSDSTGSIGRSKSPAPPGKKPKPESMRTKKPPRKELDGNKWIIVSSNLTSTPALYFYSLLYF
jgi:adenylyl cyclase-associated protein